MNAHQKLVFCPQQTSFKEEEEEKELSPVQAVRAACPKRSLNFFLSSRYNRQQSCGSTEEQCKTKYLLYVYIYVFNLYLY